MSYATESSLSNARPTRRNNGILQFRCECGLPISRKTSRTDKNPGRIFFSCDSQERNGSHFFKWLDDAIIEELDGFRDELHEVKMEKMMDVKMEKMMEKMNVRMDKMNQNMEKMNVKMVEYNNVVVIFGVVVIGVAMFFGYYYGLSYV
ncbi:PREDICTED: uncharacterized protein At4g04775-like [Tarenaya hassleriana]|uniref:uncharacterized protein At4g04775-like n=1 Tax=Tarenaya hassleriana TaxID=28532 RepID=UPI00053C770A|nr:PREDICTED: uncharacterized protein At4g04775-like [Tarenaya hassleriana]